MKRFFILSAKIIIIGVLLWLLEHFSLLKLNLLSYTFTKPLHAIAVIFLFFLLVLINAWRWYLLNRAQGIPFTFLKTIMPTYMGTVCNNILPGNVGGDVARVCYLFKKVPERKSGAMLSVLFDRMTGLMSIFIVVSVVGLLSLPIISHNASLYYFLLICISVCVGALALFAASILLPKEMGISQWLQNKFSNKKWLAPVLSMLQAIHVYRTSKKVIIQCLLISVLIQVIMVLMVEVIGHMIGIPTVSLSHYAIALAVTQLANLIPVTPGGIGVGELVFANTLVLLSHGVSAAYATIFLLYRLLGIVSYVPGIVFYIFKLTTHSWLELPSPALNNTRKADF